jgi:23S rRNA pseudouridine2605 synthase
MGEATRFPVMRLARTSFAGISADALTPGQLRPLTIEELRALKNAFDVPKKVRPAAPMPLQPSRKASPKRESPAPAHGKGSVGKGRAASSTGAGLRQRMGARNEPRPPTASAPTKRSR